MQLTVGTYVRLSELSTGHPGRLCGRCGRTTAAKRRLNLPRRTARNTKHNCTAKHSPIGAGRAPSCTIVRTSSYSTRFFWPVIIFFWPGNICAFTWQRPHSATCSPVAETGGTCDRGNESLHHQADTGSFEPTDEGITPLRAGHPFRPQHASVPIMHG